MKQRALIVQAYEGLEVAFTEDGWFNATKAAERFGKTPHEWLRLPTTREYLAAVERKYGKIPYLKTRRGNSGGTWLHPKLGVRFAQWLDVDFAVWCDEQIDALLKGEHPHFNWKLQRHAAASSCKVMNAVLQLVRQAQGKQTARHHFANEARLINWVLTGTFGTVDRTTLTAPELQLLADLEERNTVLMGLGLGYALRKAALEQFVTVGRARVPGTAA